MFGQCRRRRPARRTIVPGGSIPSARVHGPWTWTPSRRVRLRRIDLTAHQRSRRRFGGSAIFAARRTKRGVVPLVWCVPPPHSINFPSGGCQRIPSLLVIGRCRRVIARSRGAVDVTALRALRAAGMPTLALWPAWDWQDGPGGGRLPRPGHGGRRRRHHSGRLRRYLQSSEASIS
jgi:hypothetical protein